MEEFLEFLVPVLMLPYTQPKASDMFLYTLPTSALFFHYKPVSIYLPK